MDRHVCTAIVGDNELPGVVHIATKKCNFILHDQKGYAESYVELVLGTPAELTASWWLYDVGDIIPPGAFVGGQTDKGIKLFVCRASISGVYYSGYYDHNTEKACVHSGFVQHSSQVELLAFVPHGPTSAGPTINLLCPRPHIRQTFSNLHWVEHWGPDPETDAAIISGNVAGNVAAGSTFLTADTLSKFLYRENKFCTVDDNVSVCNVWGKLLLPPIPYKWAPFMAGSKVPHNVIVCAHTTENEPLYVIMKDSMEFSVGQYDPTTEMATYPSTMHILTVPMCTGSTIWTDKGFNTHSGPITAMRIQHGDTITGIRCRFGTVVIGVLARCSIPCNCYTIEFPTKWIYKRRWNRTGQCHSLFTNLKIYGPFGVSRGGRNATMNTRCGQVEFFSGQFCWKEMSQMNNTFSFNVHGLFIINHHTCGNEIIYEYD